MKLRELSKWSQLLRTTTKGWIISDCFRQQGYLEFSERQPSKQTEAHFSGNNLMAWSQLEGINFVAVLLTGLQATKGHRLTLSQALDWFTSFTLHIMAQ